jgi:N6-adenosine-specific RNA methylase IME4
MSGLAFHPLANLFPLIEGEEFSALVDDVKANGLREHIIVHEGKILDGRNRYRAAIKAGLFKKTAKIVGGNALFIRYFAKFLPERNGEPLAFVISHNLRRRHLNEAQRAAIAAELVSTGHGGDRRSAAKAGKQAANLPLVKQADAAAMFNVSERSVRSAIVVRDKGTRPLKAALKRGAIAVSAAAKAAELAPDLQARIVAEADAGRADVVRLVVKQEGRAAKERELGRRQAAAADGKFGLIVEDFEFDYAVWSRETGMDRHAANHYETAADAHSPEEIVARTADRFECAADDCVLGMWVPAPFLAIGMKVLELRSFTYCSQLVWEKDRIITGHWFRFKHENLLIGRRGKVPAPAPGTQYPSVIRAPAGRHSAKPAIFFEMFEQQFKSLRKIELNCRGKPRKGWSAWGNEAETDARRAQAGAA